MQFFGFDVQAIVPADRSARDKLTSLNRYFFDQKRFQALSDNGCVVERVTLQTVLAKRVGSPLAVSLLYAYLASKAGVELEFANVQPAGFLKFFEDGLWRFVDVTRNGRILESDELLESIQARMRGRRLTDTELFETVPHDRILVDYLNTLKMAYRMGESAEPLLAIQNWLLQFQPSNVQALGERALLHRRLGHSKSALADLKRYFAFVERDGAPSDLRRAFDELSAMLSKSRAPESPPSERPNDSLPN